jgi:hypothetical protein
MMGFTWRTSDGYHKFFEIYSSHYRFRNIIILKTEAIVPDIFTLSLPSNLRNKPPSPLHTIVLQK